MEGGDTLAFQYQFTQFATAGVITLWVYDHLVSFSEEVEVVWKRGNLHWLRALFVSNRLIPIIQSYFVGKALLPFSSHILSIQIAIAHVIFTIRGYSINNRYPQLQILLGASLFVSLLISTISTALQVVDVLSALALTLQSNSNSNSPPNQICLNTKPTSNLYPLIVTLNSIVIESIIFGTTVFQATRVRKGIADVRDARRCFGTLRRLYAQGVQFYLLTILFHFITILALYVAPLGFQFLFPTLRFYITTTLTSRFVLFLQREIVESQLGQEARAAIVKADRRTYSAMMRMGGGDDDRLQTTMMEEYKR
ncbi:hypothetical protein FRC14_005941 [Serendipita sp. 396]|nr:hypothetical protein FRC14_005941 [Serendipita sp. 396]KAG8854499.1 hypothetical protein FRB91_003456 [Serendipita sp. 411]